MTHLIMIFRTLLVPTPLYLDIVMLIGQEMNMIEKVFLIDVSF